MKGRGVTMINVFNSFFNYAVCFAMSVAIVGLAVFIGTTLRKRKDAQNKDVQ